MLDNNIMSQLGQLKAELKANKATFTATVKGTRQRFGFAILEDGREIFLPPDEMDKVFAGDSIKVNLNKDKQDKEFAEVDELIHSELNTFHGSIVKRGKTLFVNPDINGFSRLIYIPPSEHKKVQAGSYVIAKINRHPIKLGKAQATIVELIGHADDRGIEHAYITAKYHLTPSISEDVNAEVSAINQSTIDELAVQRQDLRNTPFVTIDAAMTEDMDDAVFAQPSEQGWKLQVAIADPSAFVTPGSALDTLAQQTMISSYLPGGLSPMLPSELTNNLCSLRPNEDRLALVLTLDISTDGEVIRQDFTLAVVRSHAKLSYQNVGHYIEQTQHTLTEQQQGLIDNLRSATQAIHHWRQQQCLIMPERSDFRFQLNDDGRIENIYEVKRNDAHRLIEECMLAANLATARYLDLHQIESLHINHLGFKEEKLGDVEKLLSEELGYEVKGLQELDNYKSIIRKLDDLEHELPLRPILNRSLQRSEVSRQPGAHFGLGFDHYATFTSPIRKYTDLINHRAIKRHLSGKVAASISDELLDRLSIALKDSRQASNEIERWLCCQYMQAHQGKEFTGVISHTTSSGFNVRLDENGIIGFVSLRSKEKAKSMSLDQTRWILSNAENRFLLEQAVTIMVSNVDTETRSIELELVPAKAAPSS